MKKIVLFLVAIAFLSANAQSLKFFYQGEEVHDTVLLEVAGLNAIEEFTVNILNNTDNELEITVAKENIMELDGSMNTFCLGACYDPSVTIAPVPLVLAAHTQSTFDDFHLMYNSGRFMGISLVKYTFTIGEEVYSLVMKYSSLALGISQNVKVKQLNSYPNPCTDRVKIQYNLSGYAHSEDAKIVITNLLGKKMQEKSLQNLSGDVMFDVEDFPAGIYFYSIEVAQQVLATKKLIVK